MDKFLLKLAATPWVLRQITKATAYIGAALTPILAKAEVTVDGKTIDFFSAENEAAVVAAVVAATAAGIEAFLSWAADRARKQS